MPCPDCTDFDYEQLRDRVNELEGDLTELRTGRIRYVTCFRCDHSIPYRGATANAPEYCSETCELGNSPVRDRQHPLYGRCIA